MQQEHFRGARSKLLCVTHVFEAPLKDGSI